MSSAILLIGSCLVGFVGERETPAGPTQWVYVGTYTNGGKSKGIYRLELDPTTGMVVNRGLAAESVDPSFLAIHPSRKFLYAANEVSRFRGKSAGAVSAFALDAKTGALEALNQESSGGSGPCHLSVDATGKALLVANYGGGSVAALPLAEDGKVGEISVFIQDEGSSADKSRQSEPHAHSINVDPTNKFAAAADLGLDRIFVYALDPSKPGLAPIRPAFASVAPGSGPRHFAFHPDGKHAYVINEIKSTVTAFDFDPAKGTLTEIQTISTLPNGYAGKSYTAEVQVHPSGKFLYGSNRGHDSISAFSIEPGTGRLKSLGQTPTGGKTPRNFGIDPTGQFLLAANQNSDTIVVFRIDSQSGSLMPTGQVLSVPAPVCIKFVPKAE